MPKIKNPESQTQKIVSNKLGKYSHLFEEFCVLGVETTDLYKPIREYQGMADEIALDPRSIYSRSWDKSSKEIAYLKDFLFPFGYQVQVLSDVNPDTLVENFITKDTIQHDSQNFFFFKLNSESTIQVQSDCKSSLLKELNPSLLYNYYCVYTEALHYVVSPALFDLIELEKWG